MDCQTILQNEFHEKYLLEQISEEERDKYERHLRQCKSCQQELEEQRLLIAGVRAMGRQQMKTEIRRQVQEQKGDHSASFDWTRLAKIAAVLFMFVMIPSVFYYYKNTDSISLQPMAPELQDTRTATQEEPVTSPELDQTEQVDKITQKPTDPQTNKSGVTAGVSSSKKSETATRQQRMEEPEKAKEVSAEVPKPESEMSDSESPEASAAAGSKLSKPASAPSAEKKERSVQQYRLSQSSLYEMSQSPEEEPIQPQSLQHKHLQLEKAPLDRSRKSETIDSKASEEEQAKSDSFESKPFERLQFTANGHDIVVDIVEPSEKRAKRDGGEFPESFPVKITRRDSSSLEMVWELDRQLLKLDTDDVSVEMWPDQMMRIHFEEAQVSYRVDLEADSTSAIRRNSNVPK